MKRAGITLPTSLVLVLTLWSVLVAGAEEPKPEVLETWVAQLGAEKFSERLAAEQALLEVARANPAATRAWMGGRLETETDPEIAHRLKQLLQRIARHFPAQQIRFTKANLDQGIWTPMKDEPKKARYAFRMGEVLEFDSTEEVTEALAFVHRFADPDQGKGQGQGKAGNPRLFGPRQEPPSQRFVLDAEIKVLKERHTRDGLAGVHLNLEDHRSSAGLMIRESGVFAYRAGRLYRFDTTDKWHHYRFVIEGDVQKIFVDDMEKPLFQMNRPRGLGRQWATFGDGTAGAGAHAQIRNVTVARYDLKPKDERRNAPR